MLDSRILNLCARIDGHEKQRHLLRKECEFFTEWKPLLTQAEEEGIIPLLNKHLAEAEIDFPKPIQRSLSIMVYYHEQKARAYVSALKSLLQQFTEIGLTPIILKGGVLAHALYPGPEFRPMRDLDILVRESEAATAISILKSNGYRQSNAPIPSDHFHLPSMLKKESGIELCIEIHTRLYPNSPPWYPQMNFDNFLAESDIFSIGNETKALKFGNEDMLCYLYRHCVQTPLNYEFFKLINIADIVGFTEKYYDKLDWQSIRNKCPQLLKALPNFQYISPWNPAAIPEELIANKVRNKKRPQPVPFQGWPQKKISEHTTSDRSVTRILRETFFPSIWWLKIYYGMENRYEIIKSLSSTHPLHIFWWAKLHFSLLLPDNKRKIENERKSLSQLKQHIAQFRIFLHRVFTLFKKFR